MILLMTEAVLRPDRGGLAGLLVALQPRDPAMPLPPPDLDAIRDAGWAEGFAAGRTAAEAELAPLRDRLAAATAVLTEAATIDAAVLRPALAGLVRAVAEAVLAAELRQGDALAPLVAAALAAVRPGEPATLRAHPATLAALAPQLLGVPTLVDSGLGSDEFAVEGGDFVIDVALPARLAEILEGLA